jgi:DUF4097 and DUF4098 domain-containing protein YvlB
MTASEYLSRLETALGTMDRTEREDFLREMESHIEELASRRPGEDEETIVDGLTPPERLAEGLLSAGEIGAAAPAGAGAPGANPGRAFGPAPGAGEREGRPEGSKSRGHAERLRSLLESLARFEGGTGIGEGSDLVRDIAAEGLRSLRVELLVSDLRVGASEDGALHLRAEGLSDEDQLSVAVRDGAVELVERGGYRHGIDSLELSLPDCIGELELSLLSGDLGLEGLGCEVSARTKSGDIVARGCSGALLAETASGDISLEDCGTASAESASGDIEARGLGGDFVAKTASGDIEVESVGGKIGVTTSSGEVEARKIAGPFAAKSVSGGVSAGWEGAFAGAILATVSGDLSLSFDGEPDARLRLLTRTGRVEVDGERVRQGELILGSGGEELKATSVSGNIELEW